MRALPGETELQRWERLMMCAEKAFVEVDQDDNVGSEEWNQRYRHRLNVAMRLAKAKEDEFSNIGNSTPVKGTD